MQVINNRGVVREYHKDIVELTSDMTKSIYDTNENNVVDNSEKLGGIPANQYAKLTDIQASATGSYVHTQSSASNEWTIVHNLGFFPNVSIVDSAGSRVYTDIKYIDMNTVKSISDLPFSGTAYLT